MHLIPVPRDSEWVNMLLENARHGDVVSAEDGEKILEDLRQKNDRVRSLETMSLEHADLVDAENRGDMAMVHRVLSAQTVRLKKMSRRDIDTEKQDSRPPIETSWKGNDESQVLDDFEELRWS
jgi:NMD protein affecting ribosome stability and mRNA decay